MDLPHNQSEMRFLHTSMMFAPSLEEMQLPTTPTGRPSYEAFNGIPPVSIPQSVLDRETLVESAYGYVTVQPERVGCVRSWYFAGQYTGLQVVQPCNVPI